MRFLEKDLEEIIFTTPNYELYRRGLPVPFHLKRQVRIGNYGIADLVGFQRANYTDGSGDNNTIHIIELKQDNISVSTFFQALRYAKGLKRYLHKKGKRLWRCSHANIKITLIGKRIEINSDVIYLPDVFNHFQGVYIELYTYDYEIDGLKFKRHDNYSLTNEGF